MKWQIKTHVYAHTLVTDRKWGLQWAGVDVEYWLIQNMDKILTMCCKFCTFPKVSSPWVTTGRYRKVWASNLEFHLPLAITHSYGKSHELRVSATLNQLRACSSRPKGRIELFSQYFCRNHRSRINQGMLRSKVSYKVSKSSIMLF